MTPPPPKQPVCFVSIPFGKKVSRQSGITFDFDKIYETCIRPAVQAEGAICVRAESEEEELGGLIQKPIFSRLIHSELVIADLTTANPSVLFENSESNVNVPFDLMRHRCIVYEVLGGDTFTAESAVMLTTRRLCSVVGLNRTTED